MKLRKMTCLYASCFSLLHKLSTQIKHSRSPMNLGLSYLSMCGVKCKPRLPPPCCPWSSQKGSWRRRQPRPPQPRNSPPHRSCCPPVSERKSEKICKVWPIAVGLHVHVHVACLCANFVILYQSSNFNAYDGMLKWVTWDNTHLEGIVQRLPWHYHRRIHSRHHAQLPCGDIVKPLT